MNFIVNKEKFIFKIILCYIVFVLTMCDEMRNTKY